MLNSALDFREDEPVESRFQNYMIHSDVQVVLGILVKYQTSNSHGKNFRVPHSYFVRELIEFVGFMKVDLENNQDESPKEGSMDQGFWEFLPRWGEFWKITFGKPHPQSFI
jgi:hypothetical protein